MVLTGADSYGPGSGPVFVESLTCAGTEQSILECGEINTKLQSCTHDIDVSLRCTGEKRGLIFCLGVMGNFMQMLTSVW